MPELEKKDENMDIYKLTEDKWGNHDAGTYAMRQGLAIHQELPILIAGW